MPKTLLFFLAMTGSTIALGQSKLKKNNSVKDWVSLASSLDSASFEKQINPESYAITAVDWTKIEKWKQDKNIQGDSLFKMLSNWNFYSTPKQTGVICKFQTQVDTNYTVPYFVYIPKNYNPAQKTILLVYYKGGWLSRKNFPKDYAKEIVTDNPTFSYLDDYNIIEIFPALKNDLAIYGNYGYAHLSNMITETRKRFNIDDNKIFLSGFSDGGKTVYNVSYLTQTTFACFYPINGAIVSPPYFPNWLNRPVFSFVATKDELTDYKSIRTKAAYANKIGADWIYWELSGKGHFYFPYAKDILTTLFTHMNVTSRNPLSKRLVYDRGFNDEANFKGVDWLQIKVNTKKLPSRFHTTDTIQTFSGSGEERNYRYGENIGQARAECFNNTYFITTSQVDKVTIYISPLMVNLDLPVRIVINEKEVFNARVDYEKEFMINNFMSNFDRAQIFVNKVEITVEE